MEFKPKYITQDKCYEVDIDSLDIKYSLPEKEWGQAKDVTDVSITVYNTNSGQMSSKSLYVGKKGLYFKAKINYYTDASRYYIKDLEEITDDKKRK